MGTTGNRTHEANAVWANLTAGGSSDPFHLSDSGQLLAASVVTAVVGSPTLTVFLDLADEGGSWRQSLALAAQTAAGAQTATGRPAVSLGSQSKLARLRWTLTGGGSAFALLVAVGR